MNDSKELKAKIAWRKFDDVELDDKFVTYGGPLDGEWKLVCQGRPPIKVNLPRYADHPAGKPYAGLSPG